MERRAGIVLAVIVCVGVLLTGFGLAAKIAAPTASTVTSSPTEGLELGPQAEPPRFRVMSVQQLKTQRAGLARIQVLSPGTSGLPPVSASGLQHAEPELGNPAYSQGSGVVLDVMHPADTATQSTLVARGVIWSERVRREVLAADPATSFAIGVQKARQLIANAYFDQLPSAAHTYMVTIGTSADVSRTNVRIGGSLLSSSQLVASPGTSEVRALFTYEAGGHGNKLMVLVQVSPSTSTITETVHLHHIQLAQLD